MNALTRWAVVLAAMAVALATRAEPAPACGNMASFGSMGRHAPAEKVATAPWGEGKGGEAKEQAGAPQGSAETPPSDPRAAGREPGPASGSGGGGRNSPERPH